MKAAKLVRRGLCLAAVMCSPRAGCPSPRALALRVAATLLFSAGLLCAQAVPETIGRMEGDVIAVKGAVSVEVENGRSTTVLASGSEVTVRSGQARLLLMEGGEVGICGPAHFTLLKSGGAITLALDYGRVHMRLGHPAPLAVYTPMVVATPIAIGDGTRDATVGLEPNGAMCVLAVRGALRVEQQLTGQSLLVPQGGEFSLLGGLLDSLRGAPGACQCEVLLAKSAAPSAPNPSELSVPITARPMPTIQPAEKPAPPEKNERAEQDVSKNESVKDLPSSTRNDSEPPAREVPIYQVFMPPLTFSAAEPAPPPDPSPETILLVRQVRVRPAVVFRGRVDPAPPSIASKAASPVQTAALEDAPTMKERHVIARIVNFFRRLSSRAPCAGAGCGGTAR